MTKSDLINVVAKKAHLTKKASKESIETFLGEIEKAIEKVISDEYGEDKVVIDRIIGAFRNKTLTL